MFELYDLFFVQYLMMALAKIRKETRPIRDRQVLG